MNDSQALKRNLRQLYLTSTVLVTASLSNPAQAQTQTGAPAAPSEKTATAVQQPGDPAQEPAGDVVVTGSRVVRNGYQAPTPVSVLGGEDLKNMAQPNIADAVNRLPQFAGSVRPQNQGLGISGGTGGLNALNLRGIGTTRTLVLLDGRRAGSGTVDVSSLPNDLVSRVDVVTGGASAAYGSDALTGVVNFVLDKKYTGFKATVEGGVTTYGDDGNVRVAATLGKPFAGGRGHILLSGEYAYEDGIRHNDRDWNADSFQAIRNPAYAAGNGQPQYITIREAGLVNATRGGLITAGPLRGTQFVTAGTPVPFQFGSLTSGNLMQGGDWQTSRIDNESMLQLRLSRFNAFSRVSYDIADNVTAFGEFNYSQSIGKNLGATYNYVLGTLTIQSGNPFIPASIQSQMNRLGLSSFTMGTLNADAGLLAAENRRDVYRYAAGLNGKSDVIGTNWTWNIYYTRNTETLDAKAPHDRIVPRYAQAVDAVVDPASGRIVCRSTLTNPTNGCVPYNPMGTGVNSAEAINYSFGTSAYSISTKQDVVAASASGEPVSTWAGPVSVAFGGEYRHESIDVSASALTQAGAFFAANVVPSRGSYNVKEAFLETVIPLAKDTSWAKSLDLNAAVRATDYSTSGYVTTWKAGATYTPFQGLTFRGTRSRDIRAANLSDLYTAGIRLTQNVIDPVLGRNYIIAAQNEGNPDLKPEKADTLGLGVVLAPSFLPGFGASVDYYDIDIKGAIQSIGYQQIVNLCAAGNTSFCGFVERDATGAITLVHNRPANIASQKARGIDVEVSYRVPLSNIAASLGGDLTFRALGNYVITLDSNNQGTVSRGAGVLADMLSNVILSAPRFRWYASASYALGSFEGTLTSRGISSGVYNRDFIVCQSNCPTSTAAAPTVSNNHINAIAYFDFTLNHKIASNRAELFFVMENMFDKDPPLIAGTVNQGFSAGQSNFLYYDRAGRIFRAGVRIRL